MRIAFMRISPAWVVDQFGTDPLPLIGLGCLGYDTIGTVTNFRWIFAKIFLPRIARMTRMGRTELPTLQYLRAAHSRHSRNSRLRFSLRLCRAGQFVNA